jgi:hypothetical protein
MKDDEGEDDDENETLNRRSLTAPERSSYPRDSDSF